jgi:hypothetical protein
MSETGAVGRRRLLHDHLGIAGACEAAVAGRDEFAFLALAPHLRV